MRNMIENLIKSNTEIDDKLIALSMISSATSAANLYLNSALTSSTPIEQLKCAFDESKNVIE